MWRRWEEIGLHTGEGWNRRERTVSEGGRERGKEREKEGGRERETSLKGRQRGLRDVWRQNSHRRVMLEGGMREAVHRLVDNDCNNAVDVTP
jgi:hypothetical protein